MSVVWLLFVWFLVVFFCWFLFCALWWWNLLFNISLSRWVEIMEVFYLTYRVLSVFLNLRFPQVWTIEKLCCGRLCTLDYPLPWRILSSRFFACGVF